MAFEHHNDDVASKGSKPKETESISFRLDSKDLERLRDLAAQRNESLNALVSQIIDRYLRLWIFNHSYGFFSVNMGVLRTALARLDDKALQALAEEQVSKVHAALIMNLYGKISKETTVDYLEVFSTRFEAFRHFQEGRKHTLTVYHGVDSLEFSKLFYSITSSVLALAKIHPIESEQLIGINNFAISFELS